jgi:hypothetical protein
MRKLAILVLCTFLLSCSPRDFLTRRLAGDLIAASNTFAAPQLFQIRIGVVSNPDYLSREYLELQHRGWISGSKAACTPGLAPPPCWDVSLTPAGVDTIQSLIPLSDTAKQSFTIPAARRELVAITGIAKQGNTADVEFTWKWIPMNELGGALYPEDVHYRSTATLRNYDDGWRLVDRIPHPAESLEDSLKNADPTR